MKVFIAKVEGQPCEILSHKKVFRSYDSAKTYIVGDRESTARHGINYCVYYHSGTMTRLGHIEWYDVED